jgi:hypothetical protein
VRLHLEIKHRARRWLRPALAGIAGIVGIGAATMIGIAPAQAAVPDRFGFVLWNGTAVVPSATVPAATTVLFAPPGHYRISFPGQAAAGGVVHVTAINPTPHSCQAVAWGTVGADEVVLVDCYVVPGVLDKSAFSATFESSSGVLPPGAGRFGYVDAQGTGAIISQYNSAGAPNAVVHLAVGQWLVRMPALGTPGSLDGSVQVTGVNPGMTVRCKVAKWFSDPNQQQILVYCHDAGGAFLDTRFTVSFQYQRSLLGSAFPPNHFGYVLFGPPLGPPTTNFNSVLGLGANTVTVAGSGLWLVRFPSLGTLPDDVQVTAFGPGTEFCGMLTPWAHSGPDTLVRDVNCFFPSGSTAPGAGFTVSDNSVV